MSELVTALGLVLVIEGLVYALGPRHLKTMLALVERVPEDALRTGGIIAIGIGVMLIWLARRILAA
ncbi:MAG: DUF2065 domain-containing protein [Parvibaculaceae bacterium]